MKRAHVYAGLATRGRWRIPTGVVTVGNRVAVAGGAGFGLPTRVLNRAASEPISACPADERGYMEDMAQRTTVVLTEEDERALRKASRAQGVSQSELIRRGIRLVTAAQRSSPRPTAGWLKLKRSQRRAIGREDFGDPDD